MFSKVCLPFLKFHIRVCEFLNCNYIQFDKKTGSFIISKSSKSRRSYQIKCLLFWFYFGALSVNMVLNPVSLMRKVNGGVHFLVYWTLIGLSNGFVDKAPIQLINGLIQMDKMLQGKEFCCRK